MIAFFLFCFFFFKQKTAYEMRISDWSSDVCSSDLNRALLCCARLQRGSRPRPNQFTQHGLARPDVGHCFQAVRQCRSGRAGAPVQFPFGQDGAHPARGPSGRSEEHTSELQSLMRISYAVFCLKQKKQYTNTTTHTTVEYTSIHVY